MRTAQFGYRFEIIVDQWVHILSLAREYAEAIKCLFCDVLLTKDCSRHPGRRQIPTPQMFGREYYLP
jgi:hypothetical protein